MPGDIPDPLWKMLGMAANVGRRAVALGLDSIFQDAQKAVREADKRLKKARDRIASIRGDSR